MLFSIGGHIGADFYAVILPHLMEVATVFGVAILLDNLVSYPLIFSNSLKIHPLELFFVVLSGFQFAGLGGMIVAAPVYTMLRIIAKEFLQGFDVVRSITRRV
jgi:predicted PurR-regulated permease PerM